MDGTTDRANVEDEAFLVVWCDVNGTDEKNTHTYERWGGVCAWCVTVYRMWVKCRVWWSIHVGCGRVFM